MAMTKQMSKKDKELQALQAKARRVCGCDQTPGGGCSDPSQTCLARAASALDLPAQESKGNG